MPIHSLARNAGLSVWPPDLWSRQGLCAGTRVMTLEGHLPVEFLSEGDPIVTRNGSRKLVTLRRLRLLDAPVRIGRGAFGAQSPARDMLVGSAQAMHRRDGSDIGTILPAQHLIDGLGVQWSDCDGDTIVFQLEFDDFYTFYAEGLEVVSHLPARRAPGMATA